MTTVCLKEVDTSFYKCNNGQYSRHQRAENFSSSYLLTQASCVVASMVVLSSQLDNVATLSLVEWASRRLSELQIWSRHGVLLKTLKERTAKESALRMLYKNTFLEFCCCSSGVMPVCIWAEAGWAVSKGQWLCDGTAVHWNHWGGTHLSATYI
jgi:hypothetical protein